MLRLAMSKHTEEGMIHLRGKLNAMKAPESKEGDIHEEFFEADNEFRNAVSALCDKTQADKINRGGSRPDPLRPLQYRQDHGLLRAHRRID